MEMDSRNGTALPEDVPNWENGVFFLSIACLTLFTEKKTKNKKNKVLPSKLKNQ